jgi:hypothetical protein
LFVLKKIILNMDDLKHSIRQMLQPYVCVSLSSLPTLYDQQYKSKLSPEDYGISGEFSLTRLLRKMPDIVAVAPAMDPFKGAIIIPLPPGAVVVHPPLPPDLRNLVDMSGTELGSNCGDDEDPYWVKYQEDRASEMLVAIVHQVSLPSFDPNLRSSRLILPLLAAAKRVRATCARLPTGLTHSTISRKVMRWFLLFAVCQRCIR